ncbi:hypothetical protein HYV81_01300 [Candidatus Woesearchaeota archaeon]|nr:hypothetical protein [Candidatus Woesearchaeota archaeon]
MNPKRKVSIETEFRNRFSGIEGIAIFLAALMIMLPIYSADALAATNGLSNLNVRGKDGVTGYVRSNADYYTFIARAFIDTESVNNTKVRLIGPGGSSGFAFDSCTPVADGSYDCTFSRNMSDFIICPEFSFTVRLLNQSDVLKDAKTITPICDTEAPVVTSSADKSEYGANQNVTFSFTLTDKARVSSGAAECTGLLNYITLSSGNYSRNFQIFPSGCSYSGSVQELSNAFAEGNPTATLAAFDLFGQRAGQSMSFTTDFSSPSIELKEFDIRKQDGSFVDFFVPETYLARMSFEVSDKLLDTNSFAIDLSSLDVRGGSTTPSCAAVNETMMRCSLNTALIRVNTATFSGSVTAQASDTAGNRRTRIIALDKVLRPDTAPPDFENVSITSSSGAVTGVSNRALTGITVSVDIIEQDIGLDLNTVKANLNALTPRVTVGDVARSSCSALNQNRTRCFWNGLTLDLNAPPDTTRSTALTLSFKAADKAGNNASESLVYNIFIDTQGPVVSDIDTESSDSNGTYYISANKKRIEAIIVETGSGLDAKDVLLDASGLGAGNAVPADSCTGEGQVTCVWNSIPISGSSGQKYIGINPLTKDKAGNPLAAQAGIDALVLDTIAPAVLSVNVSAVAGSQGVLPGLILTGNALAITAELAEENGIRAFLDASGFIKNASILEADDCTRNAAGNWRCAWNTDEVNIKGFIAKDLVFNFSDIAGNALVYKKAITVTGISDKPVNYWKAAVGSPSPSALDKQLVTRYDPFVWFPVSLSVDANTNLTRTPSSFATAESSLTRWPVSVTLDRCSDDTAALLSSTTGNKPEVFNFNPITPKVDSTLPYNTFFKFTMERALPPQDSVKVSCTVKVRTLVDGRELSPEETENITFTINYFNNPLGTIDSRINDEIERVRDSWIVQATWMETAQKILNFAQTVCKFTSYLFTVWNILFGGTEKLKSCCQAGIALGGFGGGFCCPLAKALGVSTTASVELAKTGFQARTAQFCKAINCQFFWGDWLRKEAGTKSKSGSDASLIDAEWAKNPYFDVLSNANVPSSVRGKNTKDPKAWAQFYVANIDPKQSLVGSVAFLCLPGVIYNLQKARVIDCRYINCLKETKNGMPLYLCTAQRDYAYCKYVWGQVFNIIPFAAALTSIGQAVTKALSHPLELVSTGLSIVCYKLNCMNELTPTGFCYACYTADTISWVTDVLCDLGIGPARCEPVWEQLKIDTDAACKEALQDENKPKVSEGTPSLG